MPLHLSPLSRRQFLVSTLAAGVVTCRNGFSAETAADPQRWIVTADTHIAADRQRIHLGAKMAENLSRVLAEVTALEPKPAGFMLDGDAALTDGRSGDYATLGELLKPLAAAAIPVHVTLGNHDDRKNARTGLLRGTGQSPLESQPLESHHVSLVEAERANWFLLDSLDVVNKTPGRLGNKQLAWLTQALDSRADKPALIVLHHDPKWPGETRTPSLIDSEPFYAALAPRKHVKAIFCGHTHVWKQNKRDDIHLINLPPVAYVFAAGQPNGWVDVRLREKGAVLKLHTLDAKHKKNGETLELAWRE